MWVQVPSSPFTFLYLFMPFFSSIVLICFFVFTHFFLSSIRSLIASIFSTFNFYNYKFDPKYITSTKNSSLIFSPFPGSFYFIANFPLRSVTNELFILTHYILSFYFLSHRISTVGTLFYFPFTNDCNSKFPIFYLFKFFKKKIIFFF